jgi:hypothetical protein
MPESDTPWMMLGVTDPLPLTRVRAEPTLWMWQVESAEAASTAMYGWREARLVVPVPSVVLAANTAALESVRDRWASAGAQLALLGCHPHAGPALEREPAATRHGACRGEVDAVAFGNQRRRRRQRQAASRPAVMRQTVMST